MKRNFLAEGRRGTGLRGRFVASLFLCLLELWAASAWATDEIQGVKLRRDQLPEGWRLTNEFPVPEEKLQPLRARFFAPIDRMLYQSLLVRGSAEIRINYASCPEERQTATVYQKMIELVGNQNVVVKRGRVVVEIISKDPSLKEAVVDRLPISPLQRRKLRSPHMPPGWKLVSEIFVVQRDLDLFEKRFEVKLEEIINQFLFVNQERLRLNYLAVSKEDEAQKAYEKMIVLAGGTNLVFKKGRIVVEAITENRTLKGDLESLLDRLFP